MHSNGRGEETPDPYRGVALPAGQQQPPATYGESVHPAGGTPWGDPAAQQGGPAAVPPPLVPQQPGQPQPLPHAQTHPHAQPQPMPAQAADATQMLPPFPAGSPAGGPPPMPAAPPPGPPPGPVPFAAQAPQPGPVPFTEHAPQPGPVPFAEATQMLPPYPGAHPGAEPAAAEATQAMPLYQDEPQGYDGYGQQQFPGGQPQQPHQYADQQQFAGPTGYDEPAPAPPDSDYDHLFRNDVPGPEQMRPRILQPHAQQPQQWQQQPGYGGDGYDGYDDSYDEDDRRRRMSPKVLIGIVVAGCVVAGLVVGGLMNSGGKASADNDGSKTPSSSASTASKAPAGGGDAKKGGGADTAQAQAQALDTLLASSGASRSSVVSAVESIKGCKNLPGAATDLRAAASQRDSLVTKLAALKVDKLPDHDRLTSALTKAWQASSAADGHYAKWADQAANNRTVCHGGHARSTSEEQAGNRESRTASSNKKDAVKLWNTIAAQYHLTKRQYSQL